MHFSCYTDLVSNEKEDAMPALQVKDCPSDVYERLRACAAEENRSISQQALTIIENYLRMREERTAPEPKPKNKKVVRNPFRNEDMEFDE